VTCWPQFTRSGTGLSFTAVSMNVNDAAPASSRTRRSSAKGIRRRRTAKATSTAAGVSSTIQASHGSRQASPCWP